MLNELILSGLKTIKASSTYKPIHIYRSATNDDFQHDGTLDTCMD